MKKHIKYVPITTFAAALAIGGSLSAADNVSLASGKEYNKSQGQVNISPINASTESSTSYRSKSRPITADDILGMNIDTSTGEKIGEIDEIFVNSETGELLAVVVSTGGFLDMGDHQTLISPKDLSFNADRSLIKADLSKEQLRTAPRYKTGDTTGLDQVRPLTKSAQDWDAQNNRENQISTRSTSQADYNRSTSKGSANERPQTGNKSQPNRQGITASSGTGAEWDAQNDHKNQPNRLGIAVSDLIGMEVENRQGEEVGDIDQVFLDLDKQKVAGVIISTGGFAGIGERQTLIGLSELSFTDANQVVVVNYSSDQIKEFPEFVSNDPSVFNDLENRTNRLPSNVNRSLRADGSSAQADRSNYGIGSSNESGIKSDRDSNDVTLNDTRSNAARDNYGQSSSETRIQAERESTAKRDPFANKERTEKSNNTGASSDVTVFNQGNSSDELAMSASIRSAIREDESLSSSANNVSIITKDEKVVLRGEVDSASEKTSVEKIAHNKAGRQNVTSELTVRNRRGHVSQ